MRLAFTLSAFALPLLLSGCEYAPLAVEANLPSLDDAVVDLDLNIYGQGLLDYSERNNSNQECVIVHDIVGWSGAPNAERECTTCSEVFTIYRNAVGSESDCDDLVPQTHSIGWDSIENALSEDPWAGNGISSEEWLADQPDVIGALRTTWTVFGERDEDPYWEARFVIEEIEDPAEWPEVPDSVELTRAYSFRDRWRWAVSDAQSVSWTMQLGFTD